MPEPQPTPAPAAASTPADLRAARARKDRNRRVAIVGGTVVVLIAIVTAGLWYSSDSGTTTDSSSVEVAAGDGSILVGSNTAPVKVLVYEDYLCAPCKQLEDATRDFLRENAADGAVQVEYRPVNLITSTSYSARAMNAWAAVLKNASPTDALKLHDLLFEHQPAEAAADQTTDTAIAALVAKAGAYDAAVTAALKTTDNAFFEAASRVVADKGITATPAVFINGHEQTGMTLDQVVAAIEKAVGADQQ